MRVTVTGATGRIGSHLTAALKGRGDEVTVLSRDARRAEEELGVEAHDWDPMNEPAPTAALSGRDAVIHLAGEDIAQRWNDETKRKIRESREIGTRNLVAGIAAADPRPGTLASASGSDFYAPGDNVVDETAPPGRDWLADVCVRWEREAQAAADHGVRVVRMRQGIVLDAEGGALEKMLTPFKAGVGGPVAGGKQYMPWIHRDDLIGLYLAVLDQPGFSGALNASAPEPVTNKVFSSALGSVLHRPAVAPIPAFTIKLLYGEMAQLVTTGRRMVPGRADELGYTFKHPQLEAALRDTLS